MVRFIEFARTSAIMGLKFGVAMAWARRTAGPLDIRHGCIAETKWVSW